MALLFSCDLQDDAASTTVVGTPSNGTLTGAGNTEASSVDGPGGTYLKALSFDGSNDYIDFPAISTSATTSGTILALVKLNGNQTAFDAIVYSRGTGSNVSGINIGISGSLTLGYNWNDSSSTWSWVSGVSAPNNDWCLVAVAVAPTTATLYCISDTGIASAVNTTTHSSTNLTQDVNLMRDSLSGTRFPLGHLSRCEIHNTTLTQSQLLGIWEDARDVDHSLWARWAFSETSGTVADSSGNGITGTVTGAAQNIASNKFGRCIEINAANEHVTCGTSDPGTVLSVHGWFYVESEPANNTFYTAISKYTSTDSSNYRWRFEIGKTSGGVKQFRVLTPGGTLTANVTFPIQTWFHAGFSRETGGTVRIFADGSEASSGSLTLGSDTDAHITIGGLHNGSTSLSTQNFMGRIDEVWIHNRAILSMVKQGSFAGFPAIPIVSNEGRYYVDGEGDFIIEPNPTPIPTCVENPTISGPLVSGSTLNANIATWTDTTSVTRKWQIASVVDPEPEDFTDIPGETGTSYVIDPSDVDKYLRVVERSVNAHGEDSAASNAYGPILENPLDRSNKKKKILLLST